MQSTSTTQSDYTSKLTGTLNELRKQNQLCDIVIHVGGKAFPAHKAVLAASSRYFMAMFTAGYKESSENEIKIDGHAEVFEILLEFAYTGSMKIVPKLAYHLLELACYFQFTDICQHCSKLIKLNNFSSASEKISMEDVFKMYHLAKMQEGLKQIAKECMTYLCEHVKELKDTDEFLQTATSSFLEEYLEQEYLSSEEEEKEVCYEIQFYGVC